MNAMAPTRPAELNGYRVRLTTGPAVVAEARSQVRAAICAWEVPVDLERGGPAHQRTGDQRHPA